MASIEVAAEYLNVSVGYVGDLIGRGELRLFTNGYGIPPSDLLGCKSRMIEASNKAINELAELTQELNLP